MRKYGEQVVFYYTGTDEEGSVFDERTEDNPLTITLGQHALPRGIYDALLEMEVGEVRTLVLDPSKAFGEYNPGDVIDYPSGSLEDADSLQPGDIIRVAGNKVGMPPAFPKVVSNDGFIVKLDFNHPLAGKTVTYKIGLLKG